MTRVADISNDKLLLAAAAAAGGWRRHRRRDAGGVCARARESERGRGQGRAGGGRGGVYRGEAAAPATDGPRHHWVITNVAGHH